MWAGRLSQVGSDYTLVVSATVFVDAMPQVVYDLVSDVTRMGQWSPECEGGEWLGPRREVGSRFLGHNRAGGRTWTTECEVVVADEPDRFAWEVTTLAPAPRTSVWTFAIDAVGKGSRLTETFEMTDAPSGLRAWLDAAPANKRTELLDRRRQELRVGIEATLAAIKDDVESASSRRFVAVAPDHPDAVALMDALSAELASRYAAVWPMDGRSNYEPEAFDPSRDAFLIGYEHLTAVACGGLRRFAGDVVEVKRMYVQPPARARGWGRALLRELEVVAAGLGYREIVLETGSEQPDALALYVSAGYQPRAPWPPYDQRPYARCFRKPLDDRP